MNQAVWERDLQPGRAARGIEQKSTAGWVWRNPAD